MQEMSGAKIVIRGRGSQKEGAPSTGHPDDEVSEEEGRTKKGPMSNLMSSCLESWKFFQR